MLYIKRCSPGMYTGFEHLINMMMHVYATNATEDTPYQVNA